MRISEAARYLGVSPETLRVLEKKGVLKPTFKTPGGHRRYSFDDIEKIGEIVVRETKPFFVDEDGATKIVAMWLKKKGFDVRTSRYRGPDIVAESANEKWVVEIKGDQESDIGLAVAADMAVGQILRRMEEYGDGYKYFIAAPTRVIARLPSNVMGHGIGVLLITEEGVEPLSEGSLNSIREVRSIAGGRNVVATKLGDMEYEFLQKLRRRIGAETDGEALRWAVQFTKWMTETRFISIPSPEVVERIYSAMREAAEEKEVNE